MSSLVLLWAFLCIYMRREKEIGIGRDKFLGRISGQRKKPRPKAELNGYCRAGRRGGFRP